LEADVGGRAPRVGARRLEGDDLRVRAARRPGRPLADNPPVADEDAANRGIRRRRAEHALGEAQRARHVRMILGAAHGSSSSGSSDICSRLVWAVSALSRWISSWNSVMSWKLR